MTCCSYANILIDFENCFHSILTKRKKRTKKRKERERETETKSMCLKLLVKNNCNKKTNEK